MEKLFIDVTQSCRSSNNSGIQVVTRNLFREIKSLHKPIPIIWDNRLCKFAFLSKKELLNLENPFNNTYKPKSRPNKQENPFYKELLSSIFRVKRCLDLNKKSSGNDMILFPEVFRDKRVKYLPRLLHSEFRKVGLFHDANVLRNPSKTPDARSRNFKDYLKVMANIDIISCVSTESHNAFIKHTINRKKSQITKVHHLPVEKPCIKKNVKKPDTPLIICVSTLGYNKNHLTLLNAAERLWDEKLNFSIELIGQADTSWTPKVIDTIEKLKKKQRAIKWLQHIDQDTLESKYSECLFTVYPSLYEGFGLPILESLIRGKPCICGKNGALGEVSSGGGCLTLDDQSDVKELLDGIRALLTNAPLRKKLHKETQQRNYGNWKNYATELISFFRQGIN